MINDEQTLIGARQMHPWNEYGTPITIYDDGFGPLWLYREAGGLQGIVRAQSWEAAYEICQDEIMTRVPQEEVIEAYGFYVLPSKMLENLSYEAIKPELCNCFQGLHAEFPRRCSTNRFCKLPSLQP